MSKLLTIAAMLLVMTFGVVSVMAQDHHYVPMEPGNDHWYVNTGDPSLTVHTFFEEGPGGTSIFNVENFVNGVFVSGFRGHFTGTDEGDVIWIGPEVGGTLIPFSSQYLTIDAPLYAGKTWSFETSHPVFGAMQFTAEVVAEEWLTVPGIGNLYCFRVHYEEFWENVGPVGADRWYADGFGEVQILDSSAPEPYLVTSAVVIPVEEKTWGGVKSLYR